MRVVSGCIAAVFTGLLGGLILGEYPLAGLMALFAGLLFGLAVAEVAITAGKSSDWALVVVSAAFAFLGFAWAGFIEAGDSFGRVSGSRWAGALVALLSAGWWVRTLGSRAIHTPDDFESP